MRRSIVPKDSRSNNRIIEHHDPFHTALDLGIRELPRERVRSRYELSQLETW